MEDVGKNKMFLEDSFSVARILILFFFILLVVLASILDICGVVENMSSDRGYNEKSVTEREVAVVEYGRKTEVTEKKTIQSILEGNQPIEPSSDSSINKKIDEEIQGDEIICQKESEQDRADSMTNGNEVNTLNGESKKNCALSAMSPMKDKRSINISRPVNLAIAITGRSVEHGIISVLAEEGYRAGEMGLGHMDGSGAESDDCVRSEDDINCAGSSRWPGPDHRPDLTSLRRWARGDSQDKCHTLGLGEARTGQAIGTQDIGNVSREKNKLGGKKDNLTLLLQAFSVKRNLPKIFNITGTSEGDLRCLHGIRFLSMTWVILGHTFYFSLPYVDNPVWALNIIKNSWTMEAVEQGLFSVDSFFFLSGLLVSYIFLRRWSFKEQVTSPLTWVKVILHRYVRLLPPYIALVLLIEPLSFYTCSGPQVCIRGKVRQHFINFIGTVPCGEPKSLCQILVAEYS